MRKPEENTEIRENKNRCKCDFSYIFYIVRIRLGIHRVFPSPRPSSVSAFAEPASPEGKPLPRRELPHWGSWQGAALTDEGGTS